MQTVAVLSALDRLRKIYETDSFSLIHAMKEVQPRI